MPWILPALIALAALLLVSAVHELGHYAAVRVGRLQVLSLSLGVGPTLLRVRRGDTVYRWALFPFGGETVFERPAMPLGHAAIALSGAVANLLFGLGLFWAAASSGVAEPGHVPIGRVAAQHPIAYAWDSLMAWSLVLPQGVADLIAHGRAYRMGGALRGLRRLLLGDEAEHAIHFIGALSVLWGVLNLLPLPILRTDGWHVLVSLRKFAQQLLSPRS